MNPWAGSHVRQCEAALGLIHFAHAQSTATPTQLPSLTLQRLSQGWVQRLQHVYPAPLGCQRHSAQRSVVPPNELAAVAGGTGAVGHQQLHQLQAAARHCGRQGAAHVGVPWVAGEECEQRIRQAHNGVRAVGRLNNCSI